MFNTRLMTLNSLIGCLVCAAVAISLSETVIQTFTLTVLVSVASYFLAKPKERRAELDHKQLLLLIGFPLGLGFFLILCILGLPFLRPSMIAILGGAFAGTRVRLLQDRMSRF